MTTIAQEQLISWFKNPFKLAFWTCLVGYLLFYTPYGLENGDMGSIFGISWSMYNGYFPHLDFYYIKPALPPYFHSLFLYLTEDYAYVLNRGFYFVQVFSFSYAVEHHRRRVLWRNRLISTLKISALVYHCSGGVLYRLKRAQ